MDRDCLLCDDYEVCKKEDEEFNFAIGYLIGFIESGNEVVVESESTEGLSATFKIEKKSVYSIEYDNDKDKNDKTIIITRSSGVFEAMLRECLTDW